MPETTVQSVLKPSVSQKLVRRQRPATNPTLLLILFCTAQFMVVLDFSIVNVALPSIQRDLGFSTQNLQWIITAYSLTFGGFLLLGGRAGDLFGRRRLFMLGLAFFGIASFIGGFASSQLWLIMARAVQGIGAALVAPTSLSLITTTFAEGPARNKALSVVEAMASAGFAAGAILGGLLTAGPGWRWILFVNVPVALAALVLTYFLLPKTAVATTGGHKIDVLGALVVTAGLTILVYVISQGSSLGWTSLRTLGLLTLAVILLIAFVIIETRVPAPLVRLSIFRSRTLTGANLVGLLAPGVMGSLVYILTLYMQDVLHYSATITGLAFLPVAIVIPIAANISSRLVPALGVKRILVASMILVAIGLFIMSHIAAQNNYVSVVLPALIVIGLGMGPGFTTMGIAATSGIVNEEQGLASGLLATTQQVGSGLILVIVTVVIATRSATLVGMNHALSQGAALVGGFQSALLLSVCIILLAALAALVVIHQPRPTRSQ